MRLPGLMYWEALLGMFEKAELLQDEGSAWQALQDNAKLV